VSPERADTRPERAELSPEREKLGPHGAGKESVPNSVTGQIDKEDTGGKQQIDIFCILITDQIPAIFYHLPISCKEYAINKILISKKHLVSFFGSIWIIVSAFRSK
jgi:hypothetical protein